MTASTIISLLSAVFAVAKWLVGYLEKQKWMDAGAAEATLKGLQEADETIKRATKARQDVRINNARDPDSILRDDDGWKRPD